VELLLACSSSLGPSAVKIAFSISTADTRGSDPAFSLRPLSNAELT
jgi:hypothetical protein